MKKYKMNAMEKRYVLLTGATGGLGRAFAEELIKTNKNLILTATNQERLEKFRLELLKINNNIDIVCYACDMSSEGSRKNLFDSITSGEYNIEMLINNAGYITEGEIASVTPESIRQAVRVNCEGTADITKWIIDCRDKNKKLEILTVASLAAEYPMPYMAVYAASKAFVLSFMTALREEVKEQNVVVSTVIPSGIYTTQAMKDAIASQGLGGKLSSMTPEKIVQIALKKMGKAIIVPGAFNKLTRFVSGFASYTALARITGKRWKKSQKKRNMI